MKIKEVVLGVLIPGLPESLEKKLNIYTTCELSKHEIDVFHIAFLAISRFIQAEPLPGIESYGNIIITDRDELTIQLDSPKVLGNYVPFIIYPIHRWRASKHTDLQNLTCIIEEVCHCLWAIRDESAVKEKVLQIIRIIDKSITMDRLYPGIAAQRIANEVLQSVMADLIQRLRPVQSTQRLETDQDQSQDS